LRLGENLGEERGFRSRYGCRESQANFRANDSRYREHPYEFLTWADPDRSTKDFPLETSLWKLSGVFVRQVASEGKAPSRVAFGIIIVADTSPIHYLIRIEEIDILPKMYGSVVVPQTGGEELVGCRRHSWFDLGSIILPTWLDVRSPLVAPDSSLALRFTLATELHADQLIVDDRERRREAERRGIAVIGTLDVLREAATSSY
jgi:predicted nucleic acid-binding protein